MKKLLSVLAIGIVFLSVHAFGQVRIYRQLPVISLSNLYTVEVKQGTEVYQSIFTYAITPNATGVPTKNDHFASFGFDSSGGSVQIRVTRKDGVPMINSNSRLVNKTYQDVTTSYSGGSLIIDCPSNKKHLFVSVTGKEEFPLLIFVDPFADTPIPTGSNVVRFTANSQPYVQNAQFDRYTVPNNVDAVVIEDGALIKGTIHTASGRTKPLLITGRGVILGNGAVLHGAANIPYNALVITNGSGHTVENIMVINSRHFSVDVGNNSVLDNVKMFGYDANNDGAVGGDFSIIKNVFSKVNDDHVKLYNDNMKVQNCTFWAQTNGALLQLAWNSTKPGNNCLVENCEVLEWTSKCGDPKLNQGGIARTFLNLHDTDAQPQSTNLTIRNVRIQGQLDRLIGINGKYQGSNSIGFENITFENITVDRFPSKYSWIYTGNSPFKISINFKNVKMAGQCLTSTNYAINTEGNVMLNYQGCGTTTNQVPTSTILSPLNNASFVAPANITISANASDTDGNISKVEFFNGTTLLATDVTAPYLFSWNNVGMGSYNLTAKATDNLGATKVSSIIAVAVVAPNQAPSIALIAPSTGTVLQSPATILIQATAGDADGSISKVEFFNGTTLLASDLTAPYAFAWSNVTAGTYSISAKATDNDGASKSTNAVSVVVENPNIVPEVSLSFPIQNASYTAPATVVLSAEASDPDGSISEVSFFNGTTLLGTSTVPPYSFNWSNVPAGSYSLKAVAKDNKGASSSSGQVTILIENPNVAPMVSINSPLTNAVFSIGSMISISATAIDSDGSVTQVEFMNGTSVIGIDFTAPYSFEWSNAPVGIYTIFARAKDNRGAIKKSTGITIEVESLVSDISDLSVQLSTCPNVMLSWSDVGGETGYRIRRKKPADAIYTNLGDVPRNAISYIDETAQSGQTYIYMVRPLQNGVAVKLSNTPTFLVPSCLVKSISAEKSPSGIAVEPSVFDQSFTFYLNSDASTVIVELMDSRGIKVNTLLVEKTGEGTYEVQTNSLTSGWYYLKVQAESGNHIIKVFKQ